MATSVQAAAEVSGGRHTFTEEEATRGRDTAAERRRRESVAETARRRAWIRTEAQLARALSDAQATGRPREIERARRAWSNHLRYAPPSLRKRGRR